MKIVKSGNLSAFGGINFVFERLKCYKIADLLERELPALGGSSKYSWNDILNSLFSIYLCGGDCVEDIQNHLRPHFDKNPHVNLPSSDTVLRRLSQLQEGIQICATKRGYVNHKVSTNERLSKLNLVLLKTLKAFSSKELTLDYDNTILFNEKADSQMTYKRSPGYQPGVCTLNEKHILYIENRGGNSDAKSFQHETLERIFNLLKAEKINQIENFRADAASYQYEVVKIVEGQVKNFYIGCRNSYVEKYFSKINKWESYGSDGMQIGEVNITPFTKQLKKNNQQKTYRLVVKRKLNATGQTNLLTNDAYQYNAIITNNHSLTTEEVVHFYNGRGRMEKQFDVLKNDFGWQKMPFSKMEKNTVFLYMTAICQNLYNLLIEHFSKVTKVLKPTDRIKKFTFRFIILPAKWITQGRQRKLRIYGDLHFKT